MDTPLAEDIKLSKKEYDALIAQSSNYRTILRLLKASGLDNFLKDHKLMPIDLLISPDDTTGGESINLFLKSIADECNKMDQKITDLSQALVDSSILLAKEKRKTEPKKSIFQKIRDLFYI